jgi:transketolase
MGWHDIVGDAGRTVSLEHFGASADYQTLFREFGITVDAVVKAAKDSVKAAAAAVHAPAITETNPARAIQSAATDVMGDELASPPAKKAAVSAHSKGK